MCSNVENRQGLCGGVRANGVQRSLVTTTSSLIHNTDPGMFEMGDKPIHEINDAFPLSDGNVAGQGTVSEVSQHIYNQNFIVPLHSTASTHPCSGPMAARGRGTSPVTALVG